MAFPEEAVYGNLDLSPLEQWDGRDDTNSTYPQFPTEDDEDDFIIPNSSSSGDYSSHEGSSYEDNYEDLVHIASRDDEGNPCAEIEVTRTMTTTCFHHSRNTTTSNNKRSLLTAKSSSSSSSSSRLLHGQVHIQEELSPHIDTNNPSPPLVVSMGQNILNTKEYAPPPPKLPLSPSIKSVGTDLSDLEHKMTHEVNTVKDWLSKVKSDRDRYKNERNALQQRLKVADEQRIQEVSRVQKELDMLKEKADEHIEMLLEDLHTSKVQLQEMNKALPSSSSGNNNNNEEMKKQLEVIKAKLILTEEELDKEKTFSSLREATKLEEVRKVHFEDFKRQITEMEHKFRVDLATVRTQKEEEVQTLEEELETAKGVQEHLASQIDEKDDELKKIRDAYEKLSREHKQCPTKSVMEEAVQKVRCEMKTALEKVMDEKEGLAAQLEAKDLELVKVKGEFTNEHDRMKEQLCNLTKLVETKTTDVSKSHEMATSLQKELCASKLEITKAMEQITTLSEENFKFKQKAESMNQARLQYEQREKERMAEVLRLHTKLEEIHSLVPSQSHDSSKDEDGLNKGSVAAAKANVCAAVPDIDSGGELVVSVVEKNDVIELEATRKKLKIAESERDRIKAQLEDLKRFPPFTMQGPETKADASTIADLEEKLDKAEKLYIEVAVENSELKAKLGSSKKNERAEEFSSIDERMASELKSIKATLLIKNAEIATLKRRVFLKENQELQSVDPVKDTVEEVMKLKDLLIGEIVSHLEDKQQLPVSVADASAESFADVPAGISLGNDIDDIKQEHRVEIKLLMEKHASLKTQVKLLTKQKDEIARAYEVEQTCNAELESSLQEMVALLEAERSMHSGKINELKVIKHKFSKLKKKRIPVDAAYKGSLMLLEQLERKKIASQSSGETEKIMKAAIGLIDSLTHAIEKEDSSELSLASSQDLSTSSLPEDKYTKALSEACEKLELAMFSIKMQLSSKTIAYDELLKAKTTGDATHQEALGDLKKQLSEFSEAAVSSCNEKQLAKSIMLEVAQQEKDALKQQLQAAETMCEALEAEKAKLVGEVSQSKESSETMQQEKEILSQQLQHAETRVDELLDLIQEMRGAQLLNEDQSKAYQERLDELRTNVEYLQKEKGGVEDLTQKCESLQKENKKLTEDVARAKEGFEEVIAEFKQTLTATCEAHEKALREKQVECKELNDQLQSVRKEQENDNTKQQIQDAKARYQTLEDEKKKLEKNLLAEAIKHEVTQQENGIMKQQIQDSKARCQTLEEEKKKLFGEVTRAKESFEQVIAEFEDELIATCAASEQALSEKQEECKALSEQLNRLKEELSDSKETSLQEITRLTDMASADKAFITELQKELASSKEQVLRLTDLLSAHDKLLEELREELADSEESERALQDVVAIHESTIERLKKELSDEDTKLKELLKFIDQVEASKSESHREKEELEATKKALKESVEVCMQLRSEIAEKDALARENKKLEEKLQSLSKAKSGLESQAATHDQAISMIEHELETVRSEITLKNRQVQVAQEEKERTKHELDMAIRSMEEVVGSLQKQIKAVESEKEMNRAMYEKDIQLQQQEVEALQKKHSAAMYDLDSLSELISNLKESLESEKENGKILLVQFNKSEEDRKAQIKQKVELEEELAATMQSVDELTEQISCLEADLAVAITEEEERELKEKVSSKEQELNELREEERELKEKFSSQEQELKELRDKVCSFETFKKNLQDDYKTSLHKKEEESTKLRVILQETKDKLSRLHSENEKLRLEHSEAVNSMSVMLNDAVRGRAETDLSLQESIHLLEKQKRMDIKKNTQLSKLEHELQILRTKERYQESMIASLKNQIKRGR
jgi:chromosome segregation ATPase